MSKSLKHIVTVGYMGSGSSAATDLMREYSNIDCPNGIYEYVFLHCPNGVFDLEDKLLRNNTALRSDEALRTFRQTMEELFGNPHWWFAGYRKKLTPHFMEYVDELIDEITTCTFDGFWYEHEKISATRFKIGNKLARLGAEPEGFRHRFPDRIQYSFPTPEQFYDAVNSFLDKIFADTFDTNKIMLLDQLFLPHDLNRAESYFLDTKYLLVQRDPRDVFILNKYVWADQGYSITFPRDVDTFCKYYSAMMDSVPDHDHAPVQHIWFEDLILEYDFTVKEIETFLGNKIGTHINKRKYLDPSKSVRNIGVYKDDPAFAREADTIAAKLEQYLYPKPIDAAFCNRADEVF